MAWATLHVYVAGSHEVVTAAQMQAMSDNITAIVSSAPGTLVGGYRYMHMAAGGAENLVDGVWLECNGVAVSRSTYATLFSLIGTTFGVGDGSTTFNLPDLRGRRPLGHSSSGHADVNALGANEGAAIANRAQFHTHTMLTDPAHSHSGPASALTTDSNSGHFHYVQRPTDTDGADSSSVTNRGVPGGSQADTTSAPSASHTHTVSGWTATAPASSGITSTIASAPLDAPSHLVAGCYLIKAL